MYAYAHTHLDKKTIKLTSGDKLFAFIRSFYRLEGLPNFSTITMPKTPSTNAIDTQQPIKLSTHSSQVIPFYDPSFFKYKNFFQGFFLPDDYSLDILTLKQQQSQNPALKTLYSSITQNIKPDSLTPQITATPLLHA